MIAGLRDPHETIRANERLHGIELHTAVLLTQRKTNVSCPKKERQGWGGLGVKNISG